MSSVGAIEALGSGDVADAAALTSEALGTGWDARALATERTRDGAIALGLREPPGALVGVARARGATRAFLEVRATNSAAIALYREAGFRETGRRTRYYADGDDALLMSARLGPP